jgi:hypothetical protein
MNAEYPNDILNGEISWEDEHANLFDYRLQTPFRANAGAAIILDSYEMGKFFTIPMIFSFDYEYIDYGRAVLRSEFYSSTEHFDIANADIKDMYKEAHNFRAGAEVNLGFMQIRGGYAVYSSPYATDQNLLDNAKQVYSGGLGFASEHAFLDLSYSYSPTSSSLYMYNANNVFPDDPIGNISEPSAELNSVKQFFKITMGLRF